MLSESQATTHQLLKCDVRDVPRNKAEIISPDGLSYQRKRYLYNDIREFVSEQYRDLVCPQPELMEGVDNVTVPLHETPATTVERKAGRPKKALRGRASKKMKAE